MTPLFILLPVFLLLLSALGIAVLRQTRPSIGYSWLWATGISIVSLGLVLFMRWWLPLEVTINEWRPYGVASSSPTFQLDYISWPYVLTLSALLLAVLFTDSARLQTDASSLTWVVSLAIAGLGILAAMAGNPLTLILTWTAIDLAELVGVFSNRVGRWANQPMILVFAIRITGTLLVIFALLLSRAWGISFGLNPIPPELAIFMLLAVGLRLGVLPLNLPFSRDVYSWRGLGDILRMVGPASGLMVLGRMPESVVPMQWQSLFLILTAMAAVYGSAMWLVRNPEQSGRSFWIIALSALGIGSIIRGDPASSVVWGTALVLVGSVIFLYSAQNRKILFIPLLAIAGLLGLPFTPAALGWQGLVGAHFDFYSFLFMLSIVFLCWGFVRRIFAPKEELYRMERWIQTVYPTGILALVIAQWVIEASNWRIAFIPGVWWASAATTLVAAVSGGLLYRQRQVISAEGLRLRWVIVFGRRIGNVLEAVFRLNWLYQLLGLVYLAMQAFIQLLTAIFEGDGGVLWALVMLALIISLLITRGSP